MPVLRLARLAADERARGRGVGRVLLKAGFVLAKQMSHDYGCVGVVVDAKPDAASSYERYGFTELPSVMGHWATDRNHSLCSSSSVRYRTL